MFKKSNKIINYLKEFSIPLISGVIIALIWANMSDESYRRVIEDNIIGSISFHFLINEIFMVFFFAIATVEIKQSLLPGGYLNPIKRVINPILSTFGGVIGPAVIYVVLNHFIGSSQYINGWGIPTATDIALAWLAARAIFGSDHPAVSFLLLIAIIDDGIGLIIIALFYPDPANPVSAAWLLLTLAAMMLSWAMNKKKITSYWPYILICGSLSWTGLYLSHIHAALALVFIIPFLPHKKKEPYKLFEGQVLPTSALEKFEKEFSTFVDMGLFLFGLTNAGVLISGVNNLTWIVFMSLLIGKTGGIFTMSYVAMLMGFPLPKGMNKKELFTAGIIASMGLTVALFLAGSAFTDIDMQGSAKMGALFSAGAFVVAFIVSKALRLKKTIKQKNKEPALEIIK
ncbi:MAG: Na+/H+ antiporter NhaA [Eubacteriaceae bacterium]|nr:Na+/H+ antiporter NhaA [Eubacteriaceae bacterium]